MRNCLEKGFWKKDNKTCIFLQQQRSWHLCDVSDFFFSRNQSGKENVCKKSSASYYQMYGLLPAILSKRQLISLAARQKHAKRLPSLSSHLNTATETKLALSNKIRRKKIECIPKFHCVCMATSNQRHSDDEIRMLRY